MSNFPTEPTVQSEGEQRNFVSYAAAESGMNITKLQERYNQNPNDPFFQRYAAKFEALRQAQSNAASITPFERQQDAERIRQQQSQKELHKIEVNQGPGRGTIITDIAYNPVTGERLGTLTTTYSGESNTVTSRIEQQQFFQSQKEEIQKQKDINVYGFKPIVIIQNQRQSPTQLPFQQQEELQGKQNYLAGLNRQNLLQEQPPEKFNILGEEFGNKLPSVNKNEFLWRREIEKWEQQASKTGNTGILITAGMARGGINLISSGIERPVETSAEVALGFAAFSNPVTGTIAGGMVGYEVVKSPNPLGTASEMAGQATLLGGFGKGLGKAAPKLSKVEIEYDISADLKSIGMKKKEIISGNEDIFARAVKTSRITGSSNMKFYEFQADFKGTTKGKITDVAGILKDVTNDKLFDFSSRRIVYPENSKVFTFLETTKIGKQELENSGLIIKKGEVSTIVSVEGTPKKPTSFEAFDVQGKVIREQKVNIVDSNLIKLRGLTESGKPIYDPTDIFLKQASIEKITTPVRPEPFQLGKAKGVFSRFEAEGTAQRGKVPEERLTLTRGKGADQEIFNLPLERGKPERFSMLKSKRAGFSGSQEEMPPIEIGKARGKIEAPYPPSLTPATNRLIYEEINPELKLRGALLSDQRQQSQLRQNNIFNQRASPTTKQGNILKQRPITIPRQFNRLPQSTKNIQELNLEQRSVQSTRQTTQQKQGQALMTKQVTIQGTKSASLPPLLPKIPMPQFGVPVFMLLKRPQTRRLGKKRKLKASFFGKPLPSWLLPKSDLMSIEFSKAKFGKATFPKFTKKNELQYEAKLNKGEQFLPTREMIKKKIKLPKLTF